MSLKLSLHFNFILFSTNISIALFRTSAYAQTLNLLAIDTIPLCITFLLNSILLGLGKLKQIAIYGTLSVIIRWFSITIFLTQGQGLDGIIYGWIIGDSSLLLMLAFATVKNITLKKPVPKPTQQLPTLLKFSLRLVKGTQQPANLALKKNGLTC